MSKEREAFEALFPKDRLEKVKNTEIMEAAFEGFLLGCAYYQPLLEAKDAENTTLKALLEQAREGLNKIRYAYRPITTPNDREPAFVMATQTLAAINAATGEK